MKRFIIIVLTLLSGVGIYANPSQGIDGNKITGVPKSVKPVCFTDTKNFFSSIRGVDILESTANRGTFIPGAKNIHTRALKDFQTRFGDSTRASWYSVGDGFSSYFLKNGYTDRAYYNKNGRWKYTLIYFDQDRFPEDLRKIIKSNYADLNIEIVVEIQTIYGTAYMVHLGNKARICVLKMNPEGEMETISDLERR